MYKCEVENCGYETSVKSNLTKHQKNVHLKIHKCGYCNKKFQNEQERNEHEINKHQINCHLCDYKTTKKEFLKKHFETEHLKIHKCRHCNRKFQIEFKIEITLPQTFGC